MSNCDQDRNNIGNARVMGMQKDLHLTDKQFFNCLSMFCMSSYAISLILSSFL